jgi:transcriptional regulator with GAF, ATPase, and Fis domain
MPETRKGQHDAALSGRGQPSNHNQGTADINVLADQFGQLARELQDYRDTEDMLDEVVRSAVRLIPGADEGSISVVTQRQRVRSRHPTSDLPNRIDSLQEQLGQGPCLDAAFEQQTVRVRDMANEQRWPRFASRAVDAGAASMLSFQLYVEGDNLGALNLYSKKTDAFDDESEQVGLLFASHAAVAFADARNIDNLNKALSTRDLIGQAKGILMERFKVTADDAFRMLVKVSNDRNVPLRSIAEQLTTTGVLPPAKASTSSN